AFTNVSSSLMAEQTNALQMDIARMDDREAQVKKVDAAKLQAEMRDRMKMIVMASEIKDCGSLTRIDAWKFQALNEQKHLDEADGHLNDVDRVLNDLKSMSTQAKSLESIDDCRKASHAY